MHLHRYSFSCFIFRNIDWFIACAVLSFLHGDLFMRAFFHFAHFLSWIFTLFTLFLRRCHARVLHFFGCFRISVVSSFCLCSGFFAAHAQTVGSFFLPPVLAFWLLFSCTWCGTPPNIFTGRSVCVGSFSRSVLIRHLIVAYSFTVHATPPAPWIALPL